MEKINVKGNREAVVGFSTYQETLDYAKGNGLDVHEFRKVDGSQFWKDCGNVWAEYNFLEIVQTSVDDAEIYENTEDDLENIKGETQAFIDDMESFEDLEGLLRERAELVKKISELSDEQMLVVCAHEDFNGIHERRVMRYRFDGKTYEIGVLVNE